MRKIKQTTTAANNRRQQKLETLNRARLDAIGEVMQAYAWLDEVAETAKQVEKSLDTAEKVLRRREKKLAKTDDALSAYLNRSKP